MPYIKKAKREDLASGGQIETPGELNYQITQLLMSYVKREGLSYQTIAEVSGVVDNISKEFYRRIVVPYEEKKILENGDVF